MTITREEIEQAIHESQRYKQSKRGDLARLALRALDTEADARLGKAVRDAWDGLGTTKAPSDVLDAIAAALRAEVRSTV